ncbi:MAG: RNA-binding protein [Bacillota bacterium]|jgi:ribosomal protein L14E/L6E/L27E
MQFAPGNVVRSTAGRDKNHLYVVVSLAAGRVLVADGQRRTIRKLKPKNPLHLELVRSGEPVMQTDEEIRQLLQRMVDLSHSKEKGGN